MLFSKLYSVGILAFRPTKNLILSRRLVPGLLAPRCPTPIFRAPKRHIFGMNVPESQYDNNKIPNRLRLGVYTLTHYWEIIPLILVCLVDIIVILYGWVYTGLTQKVDTQFTGHNCNSISRTMDLRHPTIHKHLVFNQRYEPWPEMQEVLDKMTKAEHRLQSRMSSCPAV